MDHKCNISDFLDIFLCGHIGSPCCYSLFGFDCYGMIDGATPTLVASRCGHSQMVELLCELGADKDKAMLDGRTPT